MKKKKKTGGITAHMQHRFKALLRFRRTDKARENGEARYRNMGRGRLGVGSGERSLLEGRWRSFLLLLRNQQAPGCFTLDVLNCSRLESGRELG